MSKQKTSEEASLSPGEASSEGSRPRSNATAEADVGASFNTADSPHLAAMSPSWQRLYAAVSKTVRKH